MKFTELKRIVKWAGLALLISLNFCSRAEAQSSVTLAWSPSPSGTVVGYKVYEGMVSQVYTTTMDVGNRTNATVTGLTPGMTYYFAVTAYDSAGVESDYSGEISYTVPTGPFARLQMAVMANRQVQLSGTAPAGYKYDVQSATKLGTWSSIGSVIASAGGSITFTDPALATGTGRFYRLHQTSP